MKKKNYILNYVYKNNNPHLLRCNDCLIRAVAHFFDISWEEAFDELHKIAKKIKFTSTSNKTEETLFKQKGYIKVIDNTKGKKIGDVSFEEKTFVSVSNEGHVVIVDSNNLYDTWDCRKEKIDYYYIKE